MKSKQDLKSFFENGDKPNQEQFWALIESYFHKDEPITLEELSMLKANLATIDKTNNGTETIGNVDTKEQVNAKINAAINALKANAPETYDTLKEIADYIANDSNAEAALLQLINTKLDKPTMTNNYYGLWDDTNKKFVNGNLRFKEVNNEKALLYDVPESSDTASLFQIGGINTDSELPTDKCVLRLGKWDNGNSFSATCKYETSNNYDGFYSILTAGSNVRAESLMQALYIDERDSSLTQAFIATRVHPNYTPEIRMYTEGIINIGNKAGALLTYSKANNYWDFNVPIKVKDSLRFTLPTIITPTPNTLIPKTDGSGLVWYDNASVGIEIAKRVQVITINANTILSEIHNGAILHVTNNCSITIPTGLGTNFNCVIFAKGNITVTFVNNGNTLYSPNGLYLKNDATASLYADMANSLNLIGDLSTT